MKKPFAITLDPATSRANHTGAWRTRRPEYVTRTSPCDHACPAGELPQAWLSPAEEGDHRAAWDALALHNPFPAVMGRVCYHPCEGACNRGKLDAAVSIHAVERFLGDLAIRERWPLPAASTASTGKRVLVIGGGPSGLACAYHLVRRGHAVTLREAAPKLGGMMRYGIPKYRLPRDVLDAEIDRLVALGVRVETGARVDDVVGAMTAGGFDACFTAIGAHLANRVALQPNDAAHVLDAIALLRGVEEGEPPRLGRRVLIYGGGDTAMDAARTARRLGAEQTCIVYRRSRAEMSAHAFELEEAEQEGVAVRWLSTIQGFDGEKAMIERMALDEHGVATPTGEIEVLDADAVVLAVGQNVDLSILERTPGVKVRDKVVEVDAGLMTGHPGVFAGGDMVPGERSVAVAVGHGERAARSIDAWLAARKIDAEPPSALAAYESLNTWYYGDAPRAAQPVLDAARRRTTFDEVQGGLDEQHAELEARRCLSCGHCFECDNCFGMCPDNAIIKLGPHRGFRVDLDFCKGCGLCAHECPCGAIDMIDEPS